MDRLVKQQGGENTNTTTDLFLKWGNKKRLRCVRIKDHPDDSTTTNNNSDHPFSLSGRRRIRRRINSRFVAFPSDNQTNNNHNNQNHNHNNNIKHSSTRLTRNSDAIRSENSRKHSPEKELYTTRGASPAEKSPAEKSPAEKSPADGGGGDKSQKVKHVWPKLFLTVSNKEKEEDFMAMKGCKPSHRPKKRPKMIQRSLLLVSPGGWLSDICQDRYEVIEKKNTKKRPTGLKAMGSMESDSE